MTHLNTHMHWSSAAQALHASGSDYVVVTVLGTRGSTPRASATKMVFSSDDCFGTIGGGHLELRAGEIAAQMLGTDDQRIEYFALGPTLGQCCGGSASILFESFAGTRLNIALFGAGHVGQTLAPLLQQMPCRLHWFDSRDVYEGRSHDGVSVCATEEPAAEVNLLPAGTWFVIMTHSHQEDYAILRAALKRQDAGYIGLIGSDTKWRRFKMRMEHEGLSAADYADVHCPIGLQEVPGKAPIEVAVSVAAQLVQRYQAQGFAAPVSGPSREELGIATIATESEHEDA